MTNGNDNWHRWILSLGVGAIVLGTIGVSSILLSIYLERNAICRYPGPSVLEQCKRVRLVLCVKDSVLSRKESVKSRRRIGGREVPNNGCGYLLDDKDRWGHSFVQRECKTTRGKCCYSLGPDGVESKDDIGCDTNCEEIWKVYQEKESRKGIWKRLVK